MKSRIKAAIEFLKDEQSFKVGDILLGIANNSIQVTGWSKYINIENLNKSVCLTELRGIVHAFSLMLLESNELKTFVNDRSIAYHLDFDDFGRGSIGICSQINDQLIWHMNIK